MKNIALGWRMMDRPWYPEEVKYLKHLSRTCQELSNRYRELFNDFRKQQTKFKLPVIVLGSIVGLASFGSSQFGDEVSYRISISVGACSLFISIISSIEAYLKLGDNMSGSLVASTMYAKLKEKIDVELALPEACRSDSGLIFLRECYSEYQKIFDVAPPVLHKNRYIVETTRRVLPYTETPPSREDAKDSSYLATPGEVSISVLGTDAAPTPKNWPPVKTGKLIDIPGE